METVYVTIAKSENNYMACVESLEVFLHVLHSKSLQALTNASWVIMPQTIQNPGHNIKSE